MRSNTIFSIEEPQQIILITKGRVGKHSPEEVHKELSLDRETPYNQTGREDRRSSEENKPSTFGDSDKDSKRWQEIKTFP